MKASVDSLLEPISAENPCGVDIEYDPQFAELETFLKGKPETQFSTAEEPAWPPIMDCCVELFGRSKDLRVAVRLALAWMKTEGLPGFCNGLQVIKGLIEKYWEPVFPLLDPTDNNDPQQRVSIIFSLVAPLGTSDDKLQILRRLKQAPLAESPQLGRISMSDAERSSSGTASPEGGALLSPSQLQGAFRSTPPEKLRAIYDGITGAQAAVREIDDLLTKAVGTSRAVAFDPLATLLKDMQKTLAPYAAPNEPVETAGGESTAAAGGAQADGPGISGSVRSRQDVIRVLDQICDFYKRTEPSSPVPLILQRARRLVDMDFVQLLTDLAPESLTQIHVITGIRGGAAAGESPSA